MTGPRRGDSPLSPVRRRNLPSATPAESFSDPEIARGQSDAVMGALGRMQLRLDLMAREQSESLTMITQVLEQVLARLTALEGAGTAQAYDASDEEPLPEDY